MSGPAIQMDIPCILKPTRFIQLLALIQLIGVRQCFGHINRSHFKCIDFKTLNVHVKSSLKPIGPRMTHTTFYELNIKPKPKPIENTYVLADNVSHFGVALDN